MNQVLLNRLARWFAVIDVDLSPAPRQVKACLRELVDLLDTVDPRRLDRRASSIRQTRRGRATRGGVEIHLAHEHGDASLDIVVGEDEAIVSWLSAHEHVHAEDGDEERPWTAVVVDVVAAAMRGEYEVESHYRGKRMTRSRIVDLADPARPRVVSTTGSLVGWLPWPGEKRVEVQRLDFGLRKR